MLETKIEASIDNGRNWVPLGRYDRAVLFAKIRAGGRFLARLRAAQIIEVNGVDYRIAPKEDRND